MIQSLPPQHSRTYCCAHEGQGLECNGSCVGTWEKCAGEGIASGTIRPCCSAEDHCVEKTSKFGQCRPTSREIPPSWPSGAILTCTGAFPLLPFHAYFSSSLPGDDTWRWIIVHGMPQRAKGSNWNKSQLTCPPGAGQACRQCMISFTHCSHLTGQITD